MDYPRSMMDPSYSMYPSTSPYGMNGMMPPPMFSPYGQTGVPQGHPHGSDFASPPPGVGLTGSHNNSMLQPPPQGHHLSAPPGVLGQQQPNSNQSMSQQPSTSLALSSLTPGSGPLPHGKMPKDIDFASQHHQFHPMHPGLQQPQQPQQRSQQQHLSQLPSHLSGMPPQQQSSQQSQSASSQKSQQQQQQHPQQHHQQQQQLQQPPQPHQQHQQPHQQLQQHQQHQQQLQLQHQHHPNNQLSPHNMMSPLHQHYPSSAPGTNNLSNASSNQLQQQQSQPHPQQQQQQSQQSQQAQQQQQQQQPPTTLLQSSHSHSSQHQPTQSSQQQPPHIQQSPSQPQQPPSSQQQQQQQQHQQRPYFPSQFNPMTMTSTSLPPGGISPQPINWPITSIQNISLNALLLHSQNEYQTTVTFLSQLDHEFQTHKTTIATLEMNNQQLSEQVKQLIEENIALKQQVQSSSTSVNNASTSLVTAQITPAPTVSSSSSTTPTAAVPVVSKPALTTTSTLSTKASPTVMLATATSASTTPAVVTPASAPSTTFITAAKPTTTTTTTATTTSSTPTPNATITAVSAKPTTTATPVPSAPTLATPASTTAITTTTPAVVTVSTTTTAQSKQPTNADQQRFPLPLSQQQITQLQSDGRDQYIPLFTPTNIDSNLTAFNNASKLNFSQQQLYHLHVLKHSGHSPVAASLGVSHLYTWAKTNHATSKLAHLFFIWFKAHNLTEQDNEYILSPTYYPCDEPLLLTVPKGSAGSKLNTFGGLLGSDNEEYDDVDEDDENGSEYCEDGEDVRDFTTRTSTLASLTPIEYHHFYISVLHNSHYDHHNLTQMFQTLGVPLIPQKFVKTTPISSTSLIKQTKLDPISYQQHVYIRVPTPVDPQHNLPSNATGTKVISSKDFSLLTEKQFFVRPCLPLLAIGFIAKSPLSDEIAQNCHSTTLTGTIFDSNTNQLIPPVQGVLNSPSAAKNTTPTTENLQLQSCSYINLPWFQSFLGIQSFFTYTYLKYNRLVHRSKTTSLSFANLTSVTGQLTLLTTQNHNFLNPLNIHFFPHFTENLFEVHIPIPPKDFGHAVHNITYCKITYFKLYFLLLLLIREIFLFTTSASAAGQSTSTSSSNNNTSSIALRSPIYLRLCKKFIQDQYLYPSMMKFLESKELFYFIMKSPFFSHNLPSTTKQLIVSSTSPLYITIFNHLRRFFIVLTKLPRHNDDDRFNSTHHSNTGVSYPKVNEMFKNLYIPSQLHDFFHKELFTNAPKTGRR